MSKTILIAEDDVIVRLGLARHLRSCGFDVLEAAGAAEAKTLLQRGPDIDVLLADARLAGPECGFALAQWVRRYRRRIEIHLTGSLANKAETVMRICPGDGDHRQLLRLLQMRRRRAAGVVINARALGRGNTILGGRTRPSN